MRFLTSLAALSLLFAPVMLRAANDMVDVVVLPGWRLADGTHVAALKFVLADGWKTYWRAPGEAGIPPLFDWRGSSNLRSVEIEWPTPRQTLTNGLRTIGYEHDLVLPLRLTPQDPGQAITLDADIEIGVCNDICVPITLSAGQRLEIGDGRPDPQIAAALAARPYSAAEAGVSDVFCALTAIEGGLRLDTEVTMAAMGTDEMLVVETGDPDLWVDQTETRREAGRLFGRTNIYHVEGHGFLLDRGALRLTVLGTHDAVDIRGCRAR